MSLKASVQRPLPPMEVDRVHRQTNADTETVNIVHHLEIPLEMAKAKLGAAVKEAIGNLPLKHFGHKGLISDVCSGEKVPEYLARIVQDDAARRRFARALVQGDKKVRSFTVLQFEDEEGVA